MNKNNLLLSLIIFFGFMVRLYDVDVNPPSLYWDEASIGYEAFSLAQTGNDMHGHNWLQAIFPAYGDYKAPVYIWLAAFAIKIVGPTVLAVRLPSVIFGTVTIVITYVLAQHLSKSKKIGLFTALSLATLPWHIQFSRTGFEANVSLFFISVFILLLLKSISGKPRFAIMSSLFGIIAVYTYFSARIVVPLAFIWILLCNLRAIKKQWVYFVFSIILFFIGLIPLYRSTHYQAANQIRLSTNNIMDNHQGILISNYLKKDDQNSLASKVVHHRYIYMAKELVENIFTHVNPDYLFFKGDPNPRHSVGVVGLMLPVAMIIFVIGLIELFKIPKHLIFLFGLWLVFLLPASVPRDVPHALRSLNAVIPMTIILGYGWNKLIQIAKSNHIYSAAVMGLVIVMSINFSTYYYYLQTFYPKQSSDFWQDGYRQLAEYIWQQYPNYDYLVVLPEDRLFLYVLFFGQYDPHKVQLIQMQKNTNQADRFTIGQLEKITFRPIVWKDDQSGPSRSLLIGLPQDFPPSVKLKDSIVDKSGTTRFVSVDLSNL